MEQILVVGAGGFAKQLITPLLSFFNKKSIFFFDNINHDRKQFLNKFPIFHSYTEVKALLREDAKFVLGIGNPEYREKFFFEFVELGLTPFTLISKDASVSDLETSIDKGTVVLSNSIIEPEVRIAKGVLINLSCNITHNACIGAFTEMGPSVTVLGGAKIGERCFLGAGAIVLPNVMIGDECIVGAGTLVNKNLEKKSKVVGVPAKKI